MQTAETAPVAVVDGTVAAQDLKMEALVAVAQGMLPVKLAEVFLLD